MCSGPAAIACISMARSIVARSALIVSIGNTSRAERFPPSHREKNSTSVGVEGINFGHGFPTGGRMQKYTGSIGASLTILVNSVCQVAIAKLSRNDRCDYLKNSTAL